MKITYRIAGRNVFIQDLNEKIITDVLDIKVERLVPPRGFAGALQGAGAELLLASLQSAVRVHLTEDLSVARKTCLDNLNLEAS